MSYQPLGVTERRDSVDFSAATTDLVKSNSQSEKSNTKRNLVIFGLFVVVMASMITYNVLLKSSISEPINFSIGGAATLGLGGYAFWKHKKDKAIEQKQQSQQQSKKFVESISRHDGIEVNNSLV